MKNSKTLFTVVKWAAWIGAAVCGLLADWATDKECKAEFNDWIEEIVSEEEE